MGSVTNLQTTGDNDREMYPVQYHNHYMYCAVCGSFEFEPNYDPGPGQNVLMREKWLFRIAIVYSVLTIIWMLWIPSLDWVLIGSIVLLLIVAFAFSMWANRKVEGGGVVCKGCSKFYPPGASFFNSYEDNPRNFTMDDVPRPLYKVYQIRGKNVDDKS